MTNGGMITASGLASRLGITPGAVLYRARRLRLPVREDGNRRVFSSAEAKMITGFGSLYRPPDGGGQPDDEEEQKEPEERDGRVARPAPDARGDGWPQIDDYHWLTDVNNCGPIYEIVRRLGYAPVGIFMDEPDTYSGIRR